MEAIATYKKHEGGLDIDAQEKRPRVLVVEDDIAFGPIWSYILAKANRNAILDWSMSVFEADEKISTLKDEGCKYDLVISDIFLTGPRTGIDLWQRYHEKFDENILLVSGIDSSKMMKFFKGYDVPRYLQKPLDVPNAILTVNEFLRRRP